MKSTNFSLSTSFRVKISDVSDIMSCRTHRCEINFFFVMFLSSRNIMTIKF